LQGADDAEFAETGKIGGIDELLVRERVRQSRIGIRFARGGDAIEGRFDGAVAESVDVDDETLLVSGDAEFREFLRAEEEFAIAAGIFVGLGEIGGLRGFFDDAIGEDLDAGDVEIGNGPTGVAIHAAEEDRLFLVVAGAEVFVESVGVGPELEG
jgi:hypothetical protein